MKRRGVSGLSGILALSWVFGILVSSCYIPRFATFEDGIRLEIDSPKLKLHTPPGNPDMEDIPPGFVGMTTLTVILYPNMLRRDRVDIDLEFCPPGVVDFVGSLTPVSAGDWTKTRIRIVAIGEGEATITATIPGESAQEKIAVADLGAGGDDCGDGCVDGCEDDCEYDCGTNGV